MSKDNKLKRIIKTVLITIFWLGVWQILSAVVGLDVLLPSPVTSLKALGDLAAETDFWLSILYSDIRISMGFILGTVLGALMGTASSFSKNLSDFLSPVIHIIKSTPVASFIVLAVVWLKTGNVPSFTAMLIVIPVVHLNIKTGIDETDRQLLQMADAFKVSAAKKIKYIYVPSVKPYFISAVTTAMGLAWKAGIAAEVICNPKLSLGSGIYSSKIYLETPQLFAWTFVVVVISIILEKIMVFFLKRGTKE